MIVRRDGIVNSVVRLINGAVRSPYLFIGSGFSLAITNFYPDELLP